MGVLGQAGLAKSPAATNISWSSWIALHAPFALFAPLSKQFSGALALQSLNANLNGTVSMANSDVEVGGVFTDFYSDGTRAAPFSKCPADAPTPSNRYFDDIIIMKQ